MQSHQRNAQERSQVEKKEYNKFHIYRYMPIYRYTDNKVQKHAMLN